MIKINNNENSIKIKTSDKNLLYNNLFFYYHTKDIKLIITYQI